MVGVVALYRREEDAFAADELVTLLEALPGACFAHHRLRRRRRANANNLSQMATAVQHDGTSLFREPSITRT